jgi:hypothetical protein
MYGKACAATLAATCTVFAPAWAWAYDDVTFGSGNPSFLRGVQNYRDLVIGTEAGPDVTEINVDAYDPAITDTGWVYIRARTITINRYGRINANFAGYRGTTTGGTGYSNNQGAGGTPADPSVGPTPACEPSCDPAPGGGGGHVGAGGPALFVNLGVNPPCGAVPDGQGGTAYAFDPSGSPQILLTGMGSAGGTGHSGVNPETSGKGGNGGGVIILEASTIYLRGALWANGEDAPLQGGAGVLGAPAGGGAGGTVVVRANNFDFDATFLDPETNAAVLAAAAGGRGAVDAVTARVVGGSGSGGLVRFEVGLAVQTTLGPMVSVLGGLNGSITCSESAGASGLAEFLTSPPCVDADLDTFGAVECGGTDCDDGNPDINPGATELCNSLDDNCNGLTDEEPDTGVDAGDPRCGTGSGNICVNGECVPKPDGEPDAGTGEPAEIRLAGGLCSCRAGVTAGGTLGAALVGLLGAAGLVRRRRHRGAGGKRTGE